MPKRPHCAGTDRVVPIAGTPGHARVVARGCIGAETPYDFGMDTGGECARGYTWDCDSCPALPEVDLTRYAMPIDIFEVRDV